MQCAELISPQNIMGPDLFDSTGDTSHDRKQVARAFLAGCMQNDLKGPSEHPVTSLRELHVVRSQGHADEKVKSAQRTIFRSTSRAFIRGGAHDDETRSRRTWQLTR